MYGFDQEKFSLIIKRTSVINSLKNRVKRVSSRKQTGNRELNSEKYNMLSKLSNVTTSFKECRRINSFIKKL